LWDEKKGGAMKNLSGQSLPHQKLGRTENTFKKGEKGIKGKLPGQV